MPAAAPKIACSKSEGDQMRLFPEGWGLVQTVVVTITVLLTTAAYHYVVGAMPPIEITGFKIPNIALPQP